RRCSSGSPPWNCQRTSGCNSESLSIGRSTRTSRPSASSAARCVWKSSAGPAEADPTAPTRAGWSSMATHYHGRRHGASARLQDLAAVAAAYRFAAPAPAKYACGANQREKNRMQVLRVTGVVVAGLVAVIGAHAGAAAQTPEQFYSGKAIDLVIG